MILTPFQIWRLHVTNLTTMIKMITMKLPKLITLQHTVNLWVWHYQFLVKTFYIEQEDNDDSNPTPDLEVACNQSDHNDKNDNNEASQTYNTLTLNEFMGMSVPVFGQDITGILKYWKRLFYRCHLAEATLRKVK